MRRGDPLDLDELDPVANPPDESMKRALVGNQLVDKCTATDITVPTPEP